MVRKPKRESRAVDGSTRFQQVFDVRVFYASTSNELDDLKDEVLGQERDGRRLRGPWLSNIGRDASSVARWFRGFGRSDGRRSARETVGSTFDSLSAGHI
jgi:hypothetical protein